MNITPYANILGEVEIVAAERERNIAIRIHV
jgi:hypothetical protein